MRVCMINAVCGIGSTGRICTDIAQEMESQGHEVKIAYGRSKVPDRYKRYAVRIGNTADVYWHALMTRAFDDRGYWSRIATKRFIKWLDNYNPELLWLHNIHDYFINIEMLFNWIKSRPNMQVKWTQHDCWSFTGDCFHFLLTDCEQWKTQCENCPKTNSPVSKVLFKKTSRNYTRKKRAFSNVDNMTIITPSKWLAELVEMSYLRGYPIRLINNTVDSKVFKETPSRFRDDYLLNDKIIVLGVASVWSEKKGLYDFYNLRKVLDNKYVIVLVGLKHKQLKQLPKGIIGIERTNSTKELAQIYSAADVFLNLTYEDNYPTVNLEAQACGTPCITYRTGGSPESVPEENVVEVGDIEAVKNRILSIKQEII